MITLQQRLRAACIDSGVVSYFDDYCGRCMYGRRCVGISGLRKDCMKVISEVMQDIAVDAPDPGMSCVGESFNTLLDFDMDNMGRDMILYWPSLASEVTEHDDKDSY